MVVKIIALVAALVITCTIGYYINLTVVTTHTLM